MGTRAGVWRGEVKLTEQQQARVRKCVDLLIDEKTGMDKGQIYGFCTNLEKQGKLRADGHWGKTEMEEREMIDALKFERFAEIKGLPIFQSGSFHGGKDNYTDADIDSMATEFDATRADFQRPVKLTHKDEQNEQSAALGIIDRVYSGIRNGAKTLFADITEIPDKLVQAIRDRRIIGHSVEIYPQYKGRRNVLRALAFLGDQVPEVKGLGDLKSYVYGSDEQFITINFNESIAAASATGDNKAAASADSSTTKQNPINQQEAKVEFCKLTMPDGSVRTFATEDEFKVYHNSQIEAAKSGTVPKAQFDALQAQVESNAQAAHFAEIDNLITGLFVKNDKGEALPPFVKDKLAPVLKSIPRTIQFGEAGKEQHPAKAIVTIFAEIAKTGLVPLTEQTKSSDEPNKPADLKTWEAEAKKLFAEGAAGDGITEAKWVSAYVDLKKSEVK